MDDNFYKKKRTLNWYYFFKSNITSTSKWWKIYDKYDEYLFNNYMLFEMLHLFGIILSN